MNDLISGSLAGLAQVGVGYPFDTVKIRLQSDNIGKFKGSALDCLKQTINERALYRGITYPMIGSVLFNSITFSIYCKHNEMFKKFSGKEKWWHSFASGASVGAVSTFIETPRDLLKSHSQIPNTPYKGSPVAAFHSIWPKYGMKGLFRGTAATFLRNTLTTPFFYGFYDLTKKFIETKYYNSENSLVASALGGSAGGFGIWGILYPLDVIRTNIQLQPLDKKDQYTKFSGIYNCGKNIYKNHGLRGLYRGYWPCIVRAVPVNAAVFAVFDFVKNKF
jgi:solute carrier family 25 carnitine/acylcarnitine transporter 20/29